MPQWAGSSWYYLRYTDPKNKKEFANPKLLEHWLPVDVYFGGMEHTTLHLLYSRFWHQFLYDNKLVPTAEPYAMRVPHGIILGPDGEKMSKSRGNVVNPQTVVESYGADTLRMFEMFLGPHDATIAWKEEGMVGVYRFLSRVWNFIGEPIEPKTTDKEVDRILNKAGKEIGDDVRDFKFNTGVSGLMKVLNAIEDKWHIRGTPLSTSSLDARSLTKKQYGTFLKLLAPFAPHIAEELWQTVLKNKKSIHLEAWPKYDETLSVNELIDLVIQINGVKRDVLKITKGLSEEEIKRIVFDNENIKKYLSGLPAQVGKEIKKFIYIRDRLVNIVI
jgi:leucyl-tRNA synthetase